MAITLNDLIENPGLNLWDKASQETCCKCNTPLQETITGKRKIGDKFACSDCYYEELGEAIERHPIAGFRRG
jgi:hypothetical protein